MWCHARGATSSDDAGRGVVAGGALLFVTRDGSKALW